ncbi:MAG: helix-turn-helix domain-containing protein [Alphaproteobacteria bacterium]|nr:helix-turn-helix domain-containing protein [Alphaproteobacteria bacterium]OJV45198.1 MAG: hypothetical protein BGO28_00135 [Alphaproteobacteria bacterium 43-37]
MATKLLTEKEVAVQYKVSLSYLRNNRVKGHGFPFVKLGSKVFYREQDVENYIEKSLFKSTTEVNYQHNP